MDKAAGMSIRKMWNYCIFQSSRYRGMKYIIVLGALSAASVSYINSFLYAGILDLLLAKQYSAAKEQILILVVTVVLVSLTARACELMFRHYTEPSALETKKKTAQKTFLMEYEELEKEAVIRAFQRVRRGINGHGGITQQLMDMYHFFTGMIQAVFAAFFLGVLLVQSDFSKENKLLFAVGTAFLLLAFAAFFQLGNLAADRIGKLDLEKNRANEAGNSEGNYLFGVSCSDRYIKNIWMYSMKGYLVGKYQKMTARIFAKYINAERMIGVYNGMVMFALEILTGFIYVYISCKALAGSISVGQVVMYAGAIVTMINAIRNMMELKIRINYSNEYLKTYEEFLTRPNMHYDGTLPIEKRDDGDYELEFSHVSFRYPGTEKDVL